MTRGTHKTAALTLVETVVGIAIIGIGTACAVGALTRFNSLASTARNATGAYTAVMNQIDLIESDSPFNPQKTNPDGTAQIPPELQIGTHTQIFQFIRTRRPASS
ncbi:MAG TPA: type II secretion system protein [Chthoniobacterales bacterium]|nr:type II secretion system protein [Chthoniobacterales bacterium]